MNTFSLSDIARQRRAEAFRVAAELSRTRLATVGRESLRRRVGAGIAALGATLQTFGTALAERTD